MTKVVCSWLVIVAALTGATSAQTANVRRVPRSFLEQTGCPIGAASQNGSALVLKNVSDKSIASYVLACFVQNGKRYKPIAKFDLSEVAIKPREFTSEGGFDSSPLNTCRSRKGLVGVATVTFSDKSSWQSPLMEGAPASLDQVKK
jgi:hypothetical protein